MKNKTESNSMVTEPAILLEPYRTVYVEIPKAACTSVKIALAGILNLDLCAFGGDPHQAAFPAIEPALDKNRLFPGYFTFAIVRNPWSRLVSCYRDKILLQSDGFTHDTIRPGLANCLASYDAFKPGMTFAEFVSAVVSIPDEEADPHFRSQHTFVTNLRGRVAVDFVGRLESIHTDLMTIQHAAGLPRFALAHRHATGAVHDYRKEYDPETSEMVANRYADDIVLFEYSF